MALLVMMRYWTGLPSTLGTDEGLNPPPVDACPCRSRVARAHRRSPSARSHPRARGRSDATCRANADSHSGTMRRRTMASVCRARVGHDAHDDPRRDLELARRRPHAHRVERERRQRASAHGARRAPPRRLSGEPLRGSDRAPRRPRSHAREPREAAAAVRSCRPASRPANPAQPLERDRAHARAGLDVHARGHAGSSGSPGRPPATPPTSVTTAPSGMATTCASRGEKSNVRTMSARAAGTNNPVRATPTRIRARRACECCAVRIEGIEFSTTCRAKVQYDRTASVRLRGAGGGRTTRRARIAGSPPTSLRCSTRVLPSAGMKPGMANQDPA